MALFQTQTTPPIHSHGVSFKTHSHSPMAIPFHPPPPSLPLSLSSIRTHQQDSLFSPLTVKRKLLCRPPRGKHVREDYLVKKVSAEEVQELVKGDRNVPIIVDFFATWCGPCILMAQELEMLAVEYESNVRIVKVDTDDEYEFARDMQVRGLPTLLFISPDSSKDAIRTEGLIPLQMMRDIIDNDM
ncbi:thioredoxin-like protein CITRX, chloroplastic [Pyrus x bretschneideri]|uniref:thioredoxin-like protein CITRX, chloroplastic n=1 Tax=Pyrus x bretschneideri TaxID=225117 RepID=UPI000510ACEB|nr:thioredoxin-like protein CITRX, chloroplastic [Pyrus x bretschneideri]